MYNSRLRETKMAYDVLDISNELLRYAENTDGSDLMTNLKLQKMLYYQQGFHLAMFGTPLFNDEIEAWMYGPVVPSVYMYYKGCGKSGIPSNKELHFEFSDRKEEALFREVCDVYGKYSAVGLMNMTHREMPWKSTSTGEGNVIDKDKMRSFFRTRLKK